MFPSKADRILSRYRPIAPKLPAPIPSAASLAQATTCTDLSSTCASLDTFASSSAKIRRSRKRSFAPASTPATKCSKPRKSEHPPPQIVSTLSNTNAGFSTSSLTQGNSDGAVPGIDLTHTSPSYAVRDSGTGITQHRMMDVSDRPRVPMGDLTMVAAPFHPHNLVEQARMFMAVDALKARQPPASLHQFHVRGYPAVGMNMEKDVAFMERAAASTVLPDKGACSDTVSCNAVCMKGIGYAGGGFTEMIRGITRLPTVADVQTLMHTRSGTTGAVAVTSPRASSPTAESIRKPPTRQELHQERLELHSAAPCHVLQAPPRPAPDVDDCTLSLLPNFPSKHLQPQLALGAVSHVSQGAHSAVMPADHKCRPYCEGPVTHLSVGSRPDKDLGHTTVDSRGLCGLFSFTNQVQEETDISEALSLSPPSQSTNPLESLARQTLSSTLNRDGAVVDHIHLQQVYGGSTDPILLVDDNCQAVWFNKAYERASKSVLDRLSSKPSAAGPYIDPLGHPTSLGSLVLNQASSKPVNATLWGSLRKLVTPDVNAAPNLLGGMKLKREHGEEIDTGRLSGSGVVRGPLGTSDGWSNGISACTIDDANDTQVHASMGKLTTVTLESITEVYQGQGAIGAESVEMAEARLGASGSVPAFITDCTSRVRWVNAAFKQMLGQPEQVSSSKVMTARHLVEMSVMQHDPPELTFVGAAEKIPWSACAFSGLVNLEWMKARKRRSMTVPCDVSRLAPAATWVWKFDLALSLSLNLCA
ncbi:hypothetical protein GOP47_0013968 [Adiantum capillus-veneris]|uniref:DUF7950 domain-containing protein n=1 Tax=Adiantum capillus-veneris TaxID=13818 RepID=A0A9D4UQ00_ADICA|nr:hypothetical protein GOP47_0013968 [Adiantum capillus-veneris]